MPQFDPPYPLIHEALKTGRIIPFLGSGASLGTRADGAAWVKDDLTCLPNGTELAKYLAHKTMFPNGETIDLPKVAQYYDVVGGRNPLQEELHAIFSHDYPLASVHKFLASIETPLLIVTTNYDDLIERAFQAQGRPYDLVIHISRAAQGDRVLWLPYGETEPQKVNPNRLLIAMEKVAVIYKMHGAVDRLEPSRDQYVITEDDYIDFLARMTSRKAIPAIFAEPFQKRHFLFLGYSLRDWNFRVVLNRIDREMRGEKNIKSWAIQHQPSPLEQRFWQERGVEVYDLDINQFVHDLSTY